MLNPVSNYASAFWAPSVSMENPLYKAIFNLSEEHLRLLTQYLTLRVCNRLEPAGVVEALTLLHQSGLAFATFGQRADQARGFALTPLCVDRSRSIQFFRAIFDHIQRAIKIRCCTPRLFVEEGLEIEFSKRVLLGLAEENGIRLRVDATLSAYHILLKVAQEEEILTFTLIEETNLQHFSEESFSILELECNPGVESINR